MLTQVCLILSLWSPGWIGFQNNSYWIDMAFKHATSARLWESQSRNEGSTRDSRFLWWCCVVRDRVLALGMRRPHRLHNTFITDVSITEENFGLEAKFPSYSDLGTKRVSMLAFIWLFKLSKIMVDLAVMQRRNKFSRAWEGDKAENIVPELVELDRIHQEIKTWLSDFEVTMSDVIGDDEHEKVPVSVSTLRIVAK